MRRLGGRTWVTREEIAEIHESRAFRIGIFSEQSVIAMARLLKQAQDIRDIDRLDNEQGRRVLARQMDEAPALPLGRPQWSVIDPDYDWGMSWLD